MSRKSIFLSLGLILLLGGLPVTIFISSRSVKTQSHASASTTLYLSPTSTQNAPISATTGQSESFDVYINPGTNLVTYVELDISYDPTKFAPAGSSAFTVNSSAFPTILSGPVYNSGNFLIDLSIGGDPTKAISTITKIGTLTLTPLAATNGTVSVISFGNKTDVLSSASTDQAGENVLSTTIPAYVSISGSSVVSPTVTLVPSASPALSPTTVVATQTPAPTESPNLTSTTLNFSVFLDDIGHYGDNANPTSFTLSNQNPLHPNRALDVFIEDATNNIVASTEAVMTYNSTNGNFTASVPFSNIAQGVYHVFIKSPSYLRREIPGIQTLSPNNSFVMPPINLIAGDINGDNTINILDYNLLMECYSDLLPPSSFCTPSLETLDDLNDDGTVNAVDYNIFLREISTQNGD